MAYRFEKVQVNGVKPQVAADGSVVLKITLADGNGMKIPVEDAAAKKLRPGVLVSGFFSRMMDWSLDTTDGDKLKGTALVGATITSVEKGEYQAPTLSDEIEDVDWSKVKPKEAYSATPRPAGGAADNKVGGAPEEISDVVE